MFVFQYALVVLGVVVLVVVEVGGFESGLRVWDSQYDRTREVVVALVVVVIAVVVDVGGFEGLLRVWYSWCWCCVFLLLLMLVDLKVF